MKTRDHSSIAPHIPTGDPETHRKGTDPQVNAYLAARREWDERYGDFITRARNWRAIGFLCLIAALVQSAGLIALSMRSKTIPYVVAVDSLGRQVAAGAADENFGPDDRIQRVGVM